jgi:nucleoid DNA-binding protein
VGGGKVSYVEFVEELAKLTNTPKHVVRGILDAVPKVLIDTVLAGEDVKFKGLGRFTQRVYRAKRSFHGTSPGNISVKLIPGKTAKKRT